MASRKEIRDEILRVTDQLNDQIGTLVNETINATLLEIANPAWAFSRRKEVHHNWSWLKRKTTFDTVASQEDYLMAREIDNIYLIRQTTSPALLERWPDEKFYKVLPNPTDTGNPRLYREFGVEGVATALAEEDTLDVVSSSAADDGDDDLGVTIRGFVGGYMDSEIYTLDGTSTVSGAKTFQARSLFISKSKNTTGKITITENSGGETIAVLGPEDRNPIYKMLSLYPIPSSAITINVHYYTHLRELNSDFDTPQFHEKWHYVVRLGTLANVYQFLNKEEAFRVAQGMYSSAVRAMVAEDQDDPDLVPRMERQIRLYDHSVHIRRSKDAVA